MASLRASSLDKLSSDMTIAKWLQMMQNGGAGFRQQIIVTEIWVKLVGEDYKEETMLWLCAHTMDNSGLFWSTAAAFLKTELFLKEGGLSAKKYNEEQSETQQWDISPWSSVCLFFPKGGLKKSIFLDCIRLKKLIEQWQVEQHHQPVFRLLPVNIMPMQFS